VDRRGPRDENRGDNAAAFPALLICHRRPSHTAQEMRAKWRNPWHP
jgi:hypothetical protein